MEEEFQGRFLRETRWGYNTHTHTHEGRDKYMHPHFHKHTHIGTSELKKQEMYIKKSSKLCAEDSYTQFRETKRSISSTEG